MFPPPPYREHLAVKLDLLTNVLTSVGLQNFSIHIGFHPVTTSVDLYPFGNWQWIPDIKEEGLEEMAVHTDVTGTLIWNFPYRDSETTSASATARLASKFVRDAIGASVMAVPVFESFADAVRVKYIPATEYEFRKAFIPDIVVEKAAG